nr:MAG TPA: hypothetical protein [Caudoviricetes sp.]
MCELYPLLCKLFILVVDVYIIYILYIGWLFVFGDIWGA